MRLLHYSFSIVSVSTSRPEGGHMNDDHLEISWEQIRTILLWIALPLILGILIAAAVPRPVIGIIHLDTTIDAYSAPELIAQINYARQHPEVRAVVLMI